MRRGFGRTASAWLAGLMLVGPVSAQAASDPTTEVAALNAGLEAAEKGSAAPFPTRYAALAPVVDQVFDLKQVLKTIIGLRWSSIAADQQQALLAVFRAYTVCNYVANFNSDSGDQIRILPDIRPVGADKVVETDIVPTKGEPTRIDYVMRLTPAGWRAIDVLEQATISQAAVQRSDFRAILDGGTDKLLASLRQKVATLSGDTVKP